MADKIFINYRRDDSMPTAGRLHDRLVQKFGRKRIFMDVDHIPAGVDFVGYLDQQVARCDAFLALIGPRWLDAKEEAGTRRLDNPDDFVAIEIAAALNRAIRVIPVLIDGARMPKAHELPDILRPLARRNAVEVRNTQFGRDSEALIEKVREALRGERATGGRWTVLLTTATAALLLAGGAAYYFARPLSPEWWETATIQAHEKPESATPSPPKNRLATTPLTGFDAEVAAVRDMGFSVSLGKQFDGKRNGSATTNLSQCASSCSASNFCTAFDYDTATQRCQWYRWTPWKFKSGDSLALGAKQQVAK